MNVNFTTRDGDNVEGIIIRNYLAYEGGMRYIIVDISGREYRCVKDDDGNYIELVV